MFPVAKIFQNCIQILVFWIRKLSFSTEVKQSNDELSFLYFRFSKLQYWYSWYWFSCPNLGQFNHCNNLIIGLIHLKGMFWKPTKNEFYLTKKTEKTGIKCISKLTASALLTVKKGYLGITRKCIKFIVSICFIVSIVGEFPIFWCAISHLLLNM